MRQQASSHGTGYETDHALLSRVQRDIDRLVSKGAMGDAKKLTGFRRKIDQALSRLEERIGDLES